jgi:5-methylcytosine-specific restriction endonuclease McrA
MADDILHEVKPCKKCGATERYARGECIACARAYGASYREANRDAARLREAAYRAANAGKRKAASASYRARNKAKVNAYEAARRANDQDALNIKAAERYARNPEKKKAINALWASKNPEAIRAKDQNRRARLRASGGKITKLAIEKLYALQRGLCPVCRYSLSAGYHVDHITPLAKGGEHADRNIQLLCPGCNLRKHAKDPVEFMQRQGFLI